ncbi:hypothetical protein CKJ76_18565 [Mycobacterium avium]|nr:hypothetical protein [Mycobacterium avium]PBA70562.1 hypothetical protein CKJ76_18565 [Mycobacterium avium]
MFEDLVNHVMRQHTWAHDQWEEVARKGEELYGKGKLKYVATADGPEPRSNGQKVYVKGTSHVTGQEELFEIANVIVTFEAKWAVADVPLSHGEYDGTYFSTGTAPLGDHNTVQLVYTETPEGEFDVIGRLDGTLDTLGIQIPAEAADPATDMPASATQGRVG